jgi:NADPH-dependent glutamate synthase beta subunit-like oxidoreductase
MSAILKLSEPVVFGKESALSVQKGFAATPKDMHWLKGNIPCQAACPAGTDIPGYLEAIYRGRYDEAYSINLRDNVFPAVLGRVCGRPCEPACRHGWEGNGEPVAICFSKRSAADFSNSRKAPVVLPSLFEQSGKKIAVIGAGVAGLTAARELARSGHSVTVYEKHKSPGGMLNQGIPVFRLPRDLIDVEIEQVKACGVEIKCGVSIGTDIPMRALLNANDAVVLAAGTLKPNVLDLPGKDLKGIEHGLDFLLQVNEEGRKQVGEKVVVIGGGYTAMDCARSAIRLGVLDLKVYYRRRENDLLILPDELKQLREESGWMEFSCNPVAFLGENGRVTGIRFVRTAPGQPDQNGRRIAVPIPGSEFEVQADHVILATGQFPDTGWIDRDLHANMLAPDGWLAGGEAHATREHKIFVAGDYALGATSLIDAIGHAKSCARSVDEFLMGSRRTLDAALVQDASTTGRTRALDAIPVHVMPTLPVSARSFSAEVETGFSQAEAESEASRCYFCHYKFEIDDNKCVLCDECLIAKPVENCIVEISRLLYGDDGEIVGYDKIQPGKTKPLYYSGLYIDQTQCIRCGACARVCPTNAISIQKVSRQPATAQQVTANRATA